MKNKNALLFPQDQSDRHNENNVHDLADRGTVPRPFLKWVGGKRALIPQLEKMLPPSIENYLEPFLGGGAMFFYLQSNALFKNAKLSDVNSELIQTWQTVRESPHDLLKSLRRHKALHCEKYFYHMRDHYAPRSTVGVAARMIYLNKTCFNGLYRVNSRNKFNVPVGRYVDPVIADEENITACHKALKKTELENRRFSEMPTVDADFIYIDPPYDATFTNYLAGGFHKSSQEELREVAGAWAAQGSRVMISNSDTALIRKLYSGPEWQINEVRAGRMINSNPKGRKAVVELVIRNYD